MNNATMERNGTRKNIKKCGISSGFKNGKLYRGNKSSNNTINNIKKGIKKDYKSNNYNTKNNSRKKTKANANKNTKNYYKAFISIILVIIAIGLTTYLINFMASLINNEEANEIAEVGLQIIDETDSSGNIDYIANIPEPTINDNDEDHSEIISSNKEEIDNIILERSDEAIFFYSKRDNRYGLVGYPLSQNIRELPIKDKIIYLVQNLLVKPNNISGITMVPNNTKFLGFKILDRTLYLDFSDEFNYNIYGVEGDIQQLAQIIYTFTSLLEIDKVTFLINGSRPDYIGSHGLENREWTEKDISSLL